MFGVWFLSYEKERAFKIARLYTVLIQNFAFATYFETDYWTCRYILLHIEQYIVGKTIVVLLRSTESTVYQKMIGAYFI